MNKYLRRLIAFSILLVMVLVINSTIIAMEDQDYLIKSNGTSSEIQPQADTDHYYIIKNRSFKSTDKDIESYLTTIWAPMSKYVVERTRTVSIGLNVTPTSGSFTLSDVASTGSFNVSYAKTFKVGGEIPANPNKDSKLVILSERNNYTGDLYYVIDYGSTKQEYFRGTGKVSEPIDLYLRVMYKGEPII